MKKKIIAGCLAVLMGVMLIGCNNANKDTGNEANGKLNVMVSIYPLKEFTEKIAGDKVEVTCLVPDNMEPHDYEPKTKDFEKLSKSNLFIYNGLGMESWVDQVNKTLEGSNVDILNASDGVDVRMEGDVEDPHIWLSLKNAEKESESIKDELIKLDSDNAEYYENNYNEFKNELEELYNEYSPKFKSLTKKDFITGHAAFGYLCREFDLQQKSVENLYGGGEPTPKQLQELVTFCKENDIKTIFSESLASQKVSETLANEVGAEVVPILTLEAKEDDKDYTSAMRYNLEEIYKCLNEENQQ